MKPRRVAVGGVTIDSAFLRSTLRENGPQTISQLVDKVGDFHGKLWSDVWVKVHVLLMAMEDDREVRCIHHYTTDLSLWEALR